MGEYMTARLASGFVARPRALIPGPQLIIEWVLALALLFILACALIFLPRYMKNLVQASAKPPESCWELREIQKIVFRFNKCTGKAPKLELNPEQTPARRASMPQKFSVGQPAKAGVNPSQATPPQQASTPRKFSTPQSTSPER